jgi:hypothetical protein
MYALSIIPRHQTKVWENTKYVHRKKLRMWDVEIKLIAQQKHLALQEVFSNKDQRK